MNIKSTYETISKINSRHKKILKKHNYEVFNAEKGHSVRLENLITGDKVTGHILVLNALENLITDLLLREEKDTSIEPLSDEAILKMYDWSILCESPLEIYKAGKGMLTGEFAEMLITNYRSTLFSDYISKAIKSD